MHSHIKFTLEKPVENTLNFLDMKITYDNHNFNYCLFFKDTHSGCIIPFTSFVPHSMKKSVVLGEIHRAVNRSSDNFHILISLNMIFYKFLHNEYPITFLLSCLSSYISRHYASNFSRKAYDNCSFVKTPFYHETYYNRFYSILKRLDLTQHVKFYYKTHSLDKIFKAPKEKSSCNQDCKICIITQGDICFIKNVVYCIDCKICTAKYIGQTSRFLKNRIHEHFIKPASAVFQHHVDMHIDSNIYNIFNVSILHANIPYERKRLLIETFYIKQNRHNLMNGCVSVTSDI